MAATFGVPRQLVSTMDGHSASVLVVRATASGTYALSGSKDRTVRLWNPAKGTHINTYRGNGGDVRGLAVSNDNRQFLSCGTDRAVSQFDVTSGAVLRRFSGHDGAVNAVQYAAEESVAVSASYDATVRFWDLKSRSTRPIETVKVASDSVTAVVVPGGGLILAASVDGSVLSLDLRKGCLVRDELHHPVTSLAAPADGLYVAAACTDSAVRLLDRDKGSVVAKYVGHTHGEFQTECTLAGSDGVVLCGSEDGKVFVWNLVTQKSLGSFKAHAGVVTSLCDVPTTKSILTAGADCSIKCWQE